MTPSREGAPTFADIFVEEAADLKAASGELDHLRALVLSDDGQARPVSERTAAAQLAQGNAAAGRAAIASRRPRREAILNSWGVGAVIWKPGKRRWCWGEPWPSNDAARRLTPASIDDRITVIEAARIIGAGDPTTVRELVRNGQLEGWRIGKGNNLRAIRVSRAPILSAIGSARHPPTMPQSAQAPKAPRRSSTAHQEAVAYRTHGQVQSDRSEECCKRNPATSAIVFYWPRQRMNFFGTPFHHSFSRASVSALSNFVQFPEFDFERDIEVLRSNAILRARSR
jgi:hypothetical protein